MVEAAHTAFVVERSESVALMVAVRELAVLDAVVPVVVVESLLRLLVTIVVVPVLPVEVHSSHTLRRYSVV